MSDLTHIECPAPQHGRDPILEPSMRMESLVSFRRAHRRSGRGAPIPGNVWHVRPMVAERVEPHERLLEAVSHWPGLAVSIEPIADHLEARGLGAGEIAALQDRATLPDMVLAAACLLGHPGALEIFDRLLRQANGECGARMGLAPSERTEVTQSLRTRLLVAPPGGTPSLVTYDGRGPLLAWLRVCASREALMLRRKTTAGQLEPLGSAAAVEPFFDPELRVLAAEGQQTVKVAFQTAFDELLPPQKVLLAYHYLDRLTYRQIGKILRVDASTVSRRLADIRAALLEGTRRGVLAAPGMSRTSADEVIGMVRSQLDLSVSRLLRTERGTKASDG